MSELWEGIIGGFLGLVIGISLIIAWELHSKTWRFYKVYRRKDGKKWLAKNGLWEEETFDSEKEAIRFAKFWNKEATEHYESKKQNSKFNYKKVKL